MVHKTQNFGRLTPKYISYERVHEAKVRKAEMLQNRRVATASEKFAVWTAYFTMLYATIIIFSPDAAIAAVMTAHSLIH